MILVTGASGNVGGAVLREVLKSGKPVRALYRTQSDARSVPGNAQPVVADFEDEASLERAFEGVDAMFLVCAPVPKLVELEGNAIAVAKRAGIKHVVKNSSAGAGRWNKSFPKWHAEVEQVLAGSGVPYSLVRPNSFMQNIPAYYAGTIQTQDAFYAGAGDARYSFIDVSDVAAVVSRLLQSEPKNAVYELHGPEALTYTDVAERLSKVTGRTIRYINIPVAQQRSAMLGSGMPEWQVQAILDLQDYYLAGKGGESSDDVRRVTGHDPKPFEQFAKENVSAFSRKAATA